MKAVVDSNVGIKCVLPELDSAKAIALLTGYAQQIHELLAPDVYAIECAHALARAERKGLIVSLCLCGSHSNPNLNRHAQAESLCYARGCATGTVKRELQRLALDHYVFPVPPAARPEGSKFGETWLSPLLRGYERLFTRLMGGQCVQTADTKPSIRRGQSGEGFWPFFGQVWQKKTGRVCPQTCQ